VHIRRQVGGHVHGLLAGPWLEAARVHPSAVVTLVLGAVGLLAVALAGCRPNLRLWAVWVLVGIVPFALWDRALVFARYFYPPGPGSCVLVATGVLWVVDRLRRGGQVVLATLALALVVAGVVGVGVAELRRLQSVQLYDEGKYLLFERQDPARAVPRFEAALRRDPRAPAKVSVWLAWAWHQQNDDVRARRLLEEVLQREPGLDQARLLLQRLSDASRVPSPPEP
jgi:tetratricopeptide (TPR) repeat protein